MKKTKEILILLQMKLRESTKKVSLEVKIVLEEQIYKKAL